MAHARLLNASGGLLGVVSGELQTTPAIIDAGTIRGSFPRVVLDAEGEELDQAPIFDGAVYVDFDGNRYLVSTIGDDLEGTIELEGDLRTAELAHYLASYSPQPYDDVATANAHGIALVTNPDERTPTLLPNGYWLDIGEELKPEKWDVFDSNWQEVDWYDGSGWNSGWFLYGDQAHGRCPAAMQAATPRRFACEPIRIRPNVWTKVEITYWSTSATYSGTKYLKYQAWDLENDVGIGQVFSMELTVKSTTPTTFAGGLFKPGGAGLRVWLEQTIATASVYVLFYKPRIYVDVPVLTGWTYDEASEFENRIAGSADVHHDSASLVYDGSVWTVAATYLSTTTEGRYLTYHLPATAAYFSVYATGGGSGWTAVEINGNAIAAFDNATAAVHTYGGLVADRPLHTVKLYLMTAGEARVGRLSDGRVFYHGAGCGMRLTADGTVLDALREIQKTWGGFFEVDSMARVITHKRAGRDLRSLNVLELRAPDIVELEVETDLTDIANALLVTGRDGLTAYIPPDATAEGAASLAAYGYRCRRMDAGDDVSSFGGLWEWGELMQRKHAEPRKSVRLAVIDEAAALMRPGDTLRVRYRELDADLIVVAISRDANGGPADVTVGAVRLNAVDAIKELSA